ncbi:MAG TPA: DUF4430 domain-containing protein [Thermoanaerobacterales bacterium]|nr:DUF4430 domain-containing protein [Thermoanaerobacterales bacterium]
MRKKLISFLLIFVLLLPSFAFGADATIDYDFNGDRVTITIKEDSYKPVSIVIEDGSRKFYIDQKETDVDGKAVFDTQLERGKEYKCTTNIDGVKQTETISVEKDSPEDPEQPEKPDVAYIYIKGYRDVILPETEVKINKGDTVLSLTRRVLNSKEIDIKVRGGYVSGIDNQNEFDKGPNSGWMFTVNGKFAGIGAGSVTVRSGDYIEWLYTTDLGEDIGNIYEDPENSIVDNALDLLDDKNVGEKEIIEMVKDITDYIVHAVDSLKSKDHVKTVLKDFRDVNNIFLKVLERLKSEENFENAAANSLKIGEMAAKLLSYTDEKDMTNEIILAAKESTGIALAFVNKVSNESRIEKIIEDLLEVSIELNKKLLEKQPDHIKPEQRFLAVLPQEYEDSVDINLPGILLSLATEKGITKLDLSSEMLTAALPMDALNEIQKKQGLKITAKRADKSVLPNTVQDQIPDGSFIIEISEVSQQEFDKPIEVGIPFAGTYNNEAAVTVFLLKDNGNIQPVGGLYDSTVKKVKFFTTHFSTYFTKESIEDFTDTENHWAKKEIGVLAGKGIIRGKGEGIFEPDAYITRAEFVALITRVLGYDENHQYTIPFTDVRQKDWYYNPITVAYNNGLVNGKSATEFDPNGNITRQEMTKIISNILENKFLRQENLEDLKEFNDFEQIAPWARESAALCLREKIINGINEGVFAPLENATRAQAATILYRIYGLLIK